MFIEDVIHLLFNDINKNSNRNLSLLGGNAGCLLFKYFYLNKYADASAAEIFHEEIQQLAENSFAMTNPTFCSGLSGINWFFKFLNKEADFIDDEDIPIICHSDDELAKASIDLLNKGNYDFLHGAIGIAYYLLYKDSSDLKGYFNEFFDILNRKLLLNEKGGSFANYDLINKRVVLDEVNLGLAHGIPSILKFCLQCIKEDVCVSKSRHIAKNIIDYLISNTNANNSRSTFPNRVTKIRNCEDENSRLAWCYGDLGIGFILYQAGEVLDDLHLKLFAQNVLESSCLRKSSKDTGVMDACICHGTAGNAYIYGKMWNYTKKEVFKSASDYWINETLKSGVFDQAVAGYKMYQSKPDDKYENVYGLLGGGAGVGLVLLSALTGDFSWDYCLMLND